ncbi:hypothetical protein CJF30_00003647 [Rutstroemia sp. NJR-2017a BBW]|nr:hypothetical protein CJF30_00003647 [Rutstroemia sp. NJR-2017a BBW]
MPLEIHIPETPDEFYRMTEIRSLAFGREHAYIDMLFPRHWTHEGRLLTRDRLLDIKNNIASSRYVVVKDTETNEIIAQAKWHYYPTESAGDIMNLDFVDGESEEEKALATDPEAQRRGAGSMLVKWGVDMADSMNGETYLEATEMGRPVYEKFGFCVLDTFDAPSDMKGEVPSKQKYYLMRRPIVNKPI